MKRGHAHMKLLLRKNEVCTCGASLKLEGEQEKQSCELFFASDKLENLSLRYRASEGTVTAVLPTRGASKTIL